MSHSVAVQCDRCGGTGRLVAKFETGEVEGHIQPCGTCLGQGHLLVDARPVGHTVPLDAPLTDNEAFVLLCATRYALNRQTYAGGIVIGELLKAIPRIPYNDRKVLEREIADALFRNEVDAIHRADWQAVVDAIRQQEGM